MYNVIFDIVIAVLKTLIYTRTTFLHPLVLKYQVSLPSIGQRDIGTGYRTIILLSLNFENT